MINERGHYFDEKGAHKKVSGGLSASFIMLLLSSWVIEHPFNFYF